MKNDLFYEKGNAYDLCKDACEYLGDAAVAQGAIDADDIRKIVKLAIQYGDLQPEHLIAMGMTAMRNPSDKYAPYDVFASYGKQMIRRRDEIFADMERVAEEEARAEREQVKAAIEGRAA